MSGERRPARGVRHKLTAAERASIVRLNLQGMTDREIAEMIGRDRKTVTAAEGHRLGEVRSHPFHERDEGRPQLQQDARVDQLGLSALAG